MIHTKNVISPSFIEGICILIISLGVMSTSIIFLETVPHIPIISALIFLFLYGLVKKVPFKQMEQGVIKGAQTGLGAIFLFFMIGVLISSWMISGTIPTIMYYGFELATADFFYSMVFIICAIVGVSIGSAFTTAGTLGIAFIGIAGSTDASLPITAGAIISGAFFGDKMSPLSDTTNLASSIVHVDIFEHIKNMAWTTIPAFVLTTIVLAFLSPESQQIDLSAIHKFQSSLEETNLVHFYSLLPILLLIVLAMLKVNALATLAVSSITGLLISFIHLPLGMGEIFTILFNGYVSNTGLETIDHLLTRGGIDSMMFTISLVILALGLGGLLFTLGIIQSVLHGIKNWFKSRASTILTSVSCAFGVNLLVGEQYLSILLTGEAFADSYDQKGIDRKHLSRSLEDAGTVVNPLVPWSVCGVFLTGVLGVPTLEYLPYTFFCLLSPLFTIILGITGIGMRNQ
ncbi:Na+/H+ antiporter NhaC [Bacillus carboniphilus]|uniref:Na+/H+ antiporter NhaC n=1 Tax=Bacillus carboniphilus TaxID=86663 RepID=A0ABN0W1X7_9BACI